MLSLVRSNSWVALKLPSGTTKVLQLVPNTTISLGKYGCFPTNLILDRPYHLTYELLDKQDGEAFSRLRVVPASELHAEILSGQDSSSSTPAAGNDVEDGADDHDYDDDDDDTAHHENNVAAPAAAADGAGSIPDSSVVNLPDTNSNNNDNNNNSNNNNNNNPPIRLPDVDAQTLTMSEIEALKNSGAGAGRDLISRLLQSHTALDQKTSFSLAKYKLLKTRKYIRRFSILPLDVARLLEWQAGERDAARVLELRHEMVALAGCWGNVHFGGEDTFLLDPCSRVDQGAEVLPEIQPELLKGRWMVVDDTSGLLVAAMAERMGILYPAEQQGASEGDPTPAATDAASASASLGADKMASSAGPANPPRAETCRPRRGTSDIAVPYSQSNTITVVHGGSQPNLSLLTYYGFDVASPNHPPHPMLQHLLTVSWLQLLRPEADTSYSTLPPVVSSDTDLRDWKAARRGNFHRKRRRWARVCHAVDAARTGRFSGLVCASTMDPVSVVRHTLPLLDGGAPIAVYATSREPLARLADCFSAARRAAWMAAVNENAPERQPSQQNGHDAPTSRYHHEEDGRGTRGAPVATSSKGAAAGATETAGAAATASQQGPANKRPTPNMTADELERWSGSDEFPINPTLLLGATVHASRARAWQVLPGRTHPLMTDKGGGEGYVFTGWRVRPAEGRVQARGKGFGHPKRRRVDVAGGTEAGAGADNEGAKPAAAIAHDGSSDAKSGTGNDRRYGT